MADLQDLSVYFKNTAVSALYPNGYDNNNPVSPVAAIPIRIFEGWPVPELLDLDIGGFQLFNGQKIPSPWGKAAQVSVFTFGTSSVVDKGQILDRTYVIQPAVHGMVVSIGNDNATITVSGSPAAAGEFITVICNNINVASATFTDQNQPITSILTQLAAQLSVNIPSITTGLNTITIPGQTYLEVAVGGVGLLGKVTHRQKQTFMISTWAPDPVTRRTIAEAIDVAVKKSIRITLPDTSQATVLYEKTQQQDTFEPQSIYRRDLFYCAEYATIEEFQGTEITSVATTISQLTDVDLPYSTFPDKSGVTDAQLPFAPFPPQTKTN